MEIKKKRDVYQIIASGGFLFCAVFRFLYMFLSGWYEEVGYAWYNDEASLLTWAYASIAFVILFCPNNGTQVFVWTIAASWADFCIFRLADEPLVLVRIVLYFVITVLSLLDPLSKRSRAVAVAIRFSWLALVLAFTAILASMFDNCRQTGKTACVFYAAAVFMLLYSMAMTMLSLEIFSGFVSKLFFVPTVCALYSIVVPLPLGPARSPIVKILRVLPILGEAVSCAFYCLYLSFLKKHKELSKEHPLKRQILAMPIIILLAVIFTGRYAFLYNADIGVRQENAMQAFRKIIYQKDEYNWNEVSDEEKNVKTSKLSSSLVQLSDESMPVMFLSGGMVDEDDGNTRMLVYNEDTKKVKAVLGDWNGVEIAGFVKADEEHRRPIIYCYGNQKGQKTELIYEMKYGKPVLIGKAFLYEMTGSEISDEYSWNEESVTREEYNEKKAKALKGYKEIDWKRF